MQCLHQRLGAVANSRQRVFFFFDLAGADSFSVGNARNLMLVFAESGTK